MTWGPGSAEVDTLLEGGELERSPRIPIWPFACSPTAPGISRAPDLPRRWAT